MSEVFAHNHFKTLDVYYGLSSKDARDYDKLRKALLQRYDFTEQVYRERFKNAKRKRQESPGQLIVIICNYFNKWEELSKVGETFEGVEELMVREQFTNSCPREVSIFLKIIGAERKRRMEQGVRKKRKHRNLEELAQMAEKYLVLTIRSGHLNQQWQDKIRGITSLRDLEAKGMC